MPKLKPREIEQRRQEIIDAARRCFLRNGFHQTTTDEICHEASITPGGLYHYFGSKEEIISAVIGDTARSVVGTLNSLKEQSGDLRTAFQRVANFFIEQMRDPNLDNITRFDMETWAEALRNEKLAAITRESWALRRKWLESLIRQAIDEGLYSGEVDPKGFASLLLAVLVGLRLGRLLWRDDFDVDGAIYALFLMHSGRLTMEMPEIGLEAKRASS